MRYNAEYKEQAREKLLNASGQHAKQNGFNASGLADLAAAAGVTTGSLYKHFTGKSDLFINIIQAELKRTADMYASVDSTDQLQVSRALAGYLSLAHVHNAGAGCPLPSLTPEIGRADDEIKLVFEQGVQEIHANVKALTGDAHSAWAIMAQNVGAVMLARAMCSEPLQSELLNAVRQAGEKIIGKDKPIQSGKRS
jgi:TetR/AcrR family transcriptional regulator, transcriptional repressor for nem operon